jgi:hypothetical protein
MLDIMCIFGVSIGRISRTQTILYILSKEYFCGTISSSLVRKLLLFPSRSLLIIQSILYPRLSDNQLRVNHVKDALRLFSFHVRSCHSPSLIIRCSLAVIPMVASQHNIPACKSEQHTAPEYGCVAETHTFTGI